MVWLVENYTRELNVPKKHEALGLHFNSLHVQLFHKPGVFLDVLVAHLGLFAHQSFHEIASFAGFILVDGDADQLAGFGVHRGVFEIFGIHLAQAFEALNVDFAFAAQALAVSRALNLDPDKVNPSGGAIALGHPVGATGAILTVKALHALERTGQGTALVTMCIGGGQGIAAVFERAE